jgi:hypothetical protein
MTKVVQKPVTFEAEEYITRNGVENIEILLENSRVKIREYGGRAEIEWPPSSGFYECGPSEPVWEGNWIVLSSLGEVRNLTAKQFALEFAEEWEGAISSEQKIELLRGQLGVMAGWVMDLLERADAYVTPSEWGTLEKIKENNS